MAVTAKFLADFSAFDAAVQQAEAELRSFDTAADLAGDSVADMGSATDKAAPKVSNLQRAFGQFDSLLSSMGIHVGQAVRGLGELGDASGKTARELGAVATAGLALGAGMAGWNIGRAIANFFELDRKIADSVASLMNWGNLAAETAGAKADVLAKATAIAKREITDFGEALRIVNEDYANNKKAIKESADALLDWQNATATLISFGKSWLAVLDTIDGEVVEAVKFYLDAGASQRDLATAYGLTEGQIKAVVSQLAAEKEALKAVKEQNDLTAAAMKAHWSDVGKILDDVFGVDALNAAQTWVDAITALGGTVANLTNTQLADLREAMIAGIDALARSGQLTSEQSSRFADLAIQAQFALAALQPLVSTEQDLVKAQYEYALAIDQQLAAQAAANAAATETAAVSTTARDSVLSLGAAAVSAGQSFFSMSEGLYAAIRAAQALDELNKNVPLFGRIQPGTIANPFPGPPPGIRPFDPRTSSQPFSVTVNVTQPLGTPDQIRRAVGDAMVHGMRGDGSRLSSGA